MTVPPLLIVTALVVLVVPRGWLPNASEVGATETTDLTPVPDRLTFLVPAPASATTVKYAVLDPVLVGLKRTDSVQTLPAGTEEPQS